MITADAKNMLTLNQKYVNINYNNKYILMNTASLQIIN